MSSVGKVKHTAKKLSRALRRKVRRLHLIVALVAIVAIAGILEGAKMNLHYTSLLNVIAEAESRGNYNAYYSAPGNTDIQFTSMTIKEVLAWQEDFIKKGNPSSAVGRYQFIHTTLQDLVREHGIPLETQFSPQLQDRLAIHLLERRGVYEFARGRMSPENFAYNLSKEWAGLPKVKGEQPATSYYAGDGLNEAQVEPATLLKAIESLRQ